MRSPLHIAREPSATLGMLVAVMLFGHACAQSGEPINIGLQHVGDRRSCARWQNLALR